MANRKNLPAKFDNEQECNFCGCQFLPDEKSTNSLCAQCIANGYEIPEDGNIPVEREVLYSKPLQTQDNRVGLSSYRPKKCVRCGATFNPLAPAQKICKVCKNK